VIVDEFLGLLKCVWGGILRERVGLGGAMRKGKSSISQAKSHKEIGEFWDTHELSDFWDKTKEVSFEVDIRSEVTYFAVDKTLSERIQAIAQERGIAPDTLLNLWVQEKLQERE
jgi:hypothetical protein